MTRSERLEAALVALVREKRSEIDALQAVRVVIVELALDDAGLIDYTQVKYEGPRQRSRPARQRTIA